MSQALFNQASGLHQAGRLDEARRLYGQVLQANPRHADALHLLGYLHFQTGDPAAALDLIGKAVALQPRNPGYLYNRALILQQTGRLPEAADAFAQVTAVQPTDAEAWFDRGKVLRDLRRPAEALQCFDKVTALDPRSAAAFDHRGHVLRDLGRLEEALASHDRAVTLEPNHPFGHYHRALALQDLHRHGEALAAFDRAMTLRPGDGEMASAKAMLLLATGDFERGLPLYERRPERMAMQEHLRNMGLKPWLGQTPAAGRTILLHADQGFGDTIQFSRYAAVLAAQGARVLMYVQDALLPLLESLDGVAAWVRPSQPMPAFDLHTPLLSLPLALRTTPQAIPAQAAYLKADPARLQAWTERLGPKIWPRLGIVWSGRAEHNNDRQRSLRLKDLLARLPDGFEIVSLQQEARPEDQAALNGVRHFGEALKDFSDTAALVSLMDAVLTIDSSVAHLSGALGKDTRLLLPRIGQDWRWGIEGATTPWYPSMTLYRQGPDCAWAGPLGAAAKDLAALT